jgi:orotate phosphoribosyltransferase-like protein
MYAQENHVSTQNVAEFAEISQHLASDVGLKGLIFVDDIIASGETTIECLDRLERECCAPQKFYPHPSGRGTSQQR